MRIIIIGMVLAMSAGMAMADFEYAASVGQDLPVGMVTRCHYRTLGGYEFSINVKSPICPFQVEVDVETGQVRK